MNSFGLFLLGVFVVIYYICQECIRWFVLSDRDSASGYGWKRAKNTQNRVTKKNKIAHRQAALSHARKFLKPYKDTFGEFCLVNDNCKVSLIIIDERKKQIIGVNKHNKNGKKEFFTAKLSKEFMPYYSQTPDYVMDFMWDSICMNFSATTAYENIINAVQSGMLDVQVSNLEAGKQVQKVDNLKINSDNLLNINSASENELLALPGINVIQAKKIRKYIEKNGGFSSVDEFFEKMKIKEIFANQIRPIICVKPVELAQEKDNNNLNQENTSDDNYFNPHSDNERIIDF